MVPDGGLWSGSDVAGVEGAGGSEREQWEEAERRSHATQSAEEERRDRRVDVRSTYCYACKETLAVLVCALHAAMVVRNVPSPTLASYGYGEESFEGALEGAPCVACTASIIDTLCHEDYVNEGDISGLSRISRHPLFSLPNMTALKDCGHAVENAWACRSRPGIESYSLDSIKTVEPDCSACFQGQEAQFLICESFVTISPPPAVMDLRHFRGLHAGCVRIGEGNRGRSKKSSRTERSKEISGRPEEGGLEGRYGQTGRGPTDEGQTGQTGGQQQQQHRVKARQYGYLVPQSSVA